MANGSTMTSLPSRWTTTRRHLGLWWANHALPTRRANAIQAHGRKDNLPLLPAAISHRPDR
eukprot:10249982-Lingulodinium_polyedra.AAC.1